LKYNYVTVKSDVYNGFWWVSSSIEKSIVPLEANSMLATKAYVLDNPRSNCL